MPFELRFDKQLPAGFCMQSIKGPGHVLVCASEFVSSEDGDLLISRLDGLADLLFGAIVPPAVIDTANVNHLLAIVRPDRTGSLFVNELSLLSWMQSKKELKEGQLVAFDDIADIQRMRLLHGKTVIDVPREAGVAFVFSVGWRRGLFYDFSPLPPGKGPPRARDLEVVLGQHYAYLAFQERLRVTGQEMDQLVEERWFPFIALQKRTVQRMLDHVRNGWPVDDLLDSIHDEVAKVLPGELQKWEKNPVFAEHVAVLRAGVERYHASDYISCVSNVLPRIEGILRSYHLLEKLPVPSGHNALIERVVVSNPIVQHEHSLLLPRKFYAYLKKVFLAPFDPKDPQGLTRHTVAHGVTPVADFNKKGATLGFLILSQLAYYLVPANSTEPTPL